MLRNRWLETSEFMETLVVDNFYAAVVDKAMVHIGVQNKSFIKIM